MWLPTKASVTAIVLDTWNSTTKTYDPVATDDYRWSASGELVSDVCLPTGFQAVRATYTAGWTKTTLPRDLRDALIEMVGLKLQEWSNYSSTPDDPNGDSSAPATGALKRVESGVTLEYATSNAETQWKAKAAQLSRTIGDDLLAGIVNTIKRYRRAFAV